MICKLQDKDTKISTYKRKKISEDNLIRKQELEIKSLKVELLKMCLKNFEFEKELLELWKENNLLKGQLKKIPWGLLESKSIDGR